MKMILKISLQRVDLESDGCHLFVEARINSKKANMLVDTGASKTVFDMNRIGKFVKKKKNTFEAFGGRSTGLGTSTMQSMFTIVDEFSISEMKIDNYQAILLDMKHVNKSYRSLGLPPIDGVLGSDLLLKFNAVIDYGKATLKLIV